MNEEEPGGIQPDVTTPRPDEGTPDSVPQGGTPEGGGVDRSEPESQLDRDPGAPAGAPDEPVVTDPAGGADGGGSGEAQPQGSGNAGGEGGGSPDGD